jgi:hypothetical protein
MTLIQLSSKSARDCTDRQEICRQEICRREICK